MGQLWQIASVFLALGLAVEQALANTDSAIAITRVQRPTTCPATCSSYDPNEWYVYSSASRVAMCNQTMLLDFNIFNELNNSQTHSTIRTCISEDLDSLQGGSQGLLDSQTYKTSATYEIGSWGSSGSSSDFEDASALLQDLESYMTGNLQKSILFGYFNGIAAGVYLGEDLARAENVEFAMQKMMNTSEGSSYSAAALQYCGSTASTTMGIAIDFTGDLSAVQQHVQTWHQGACVSGFDEEKSGLFSAWVAKNSSSTATAKTNSTILSRSIQRSGSKHVSSAHSSHYFERRSTCSYVEVVSGDSCASLVTECDITDAEFYEYNTASDLCSTLAVGQYVCCSSGSLADNTPSAYANGTCYTYNVESGDSCSSIASEYDITVDDIDSYNNETWAWYGCDDLQAGESICLSTGNPPYPLSVANAVCGPQVNGTVFNSTDSETWGALNPCPLNACCDIWGECGTTPFTAMIPVLPQELLGQQLQAQMDMDASSIDTSTWTHVNFAFGNIASDFSINTDGMEDMFSQFVALSGVKRMMSFGGWDFSTDTDTYMIFREGTAAANRATLVQNIVDFLDDTGLDGVDFDWEYPGEPDIAGIPAGSSDEGDNYLAFLQDMRAALPSDAVLSITAPSSYWYLKQFPIKEISETVDFINYMTYDLHGTLDLGDAYAQWGCTAGDCLFSHINMTETMWALSMITKAGVSTNQIMVGVSSYGRSFQMTEAGCTASDCTWSTGGAAGPCTDTVGYISNAEMNEILASDSTAVATSDDVSDYLVYNSTQWVGYMTNSTKASRQAMYETYNFAGTAEWAIDLEQFWPFSNSSSGEAAGESGGQPETISVDPTIWSEPTPVVSCSAPCYMIMPPQSLTSETVISFPPWNTHVTWRATETSTTTLVDGYVDTFSVYSTYVVPTQITIAPVTTSLINMWNQPITPGQTVVYQTSSVEPSPFAITYTPTVGGNTTVIGGTTSTIPAVSYSSGNLTYFSASWTGVFGGTTSVYDGTTLSPTITTVTPHPYPTTTNTPDPEINTKKTTFKATSTGESGPKCTSSLLEVCGSSCDLFCFGGCPLCPPGFGLGSGGGGSGSGAGGAGDDSDSETTATETTSGIIATVTLSAAGDISDDIMEMRPTTTDALTYLEAIETQEASQINRLYGTIIVTPTPAATSTYSAAAATSSSGPLCTAEQDPDGGDDDTFCVCSGSSEHITTMSGSDICGYTVLPTMTTSDPYPYTFTDLYGDIVACASEGRVNDGYSEIPYCSGSRTTLWLNTTQFPYPYTFTYFNGEVVACATEGFVNDGVTEVAYCKGSSTVMVSATATATAESYPWAIWREYEYDEACVGSDCTASLDGVEAYGGVYEKSKLCDAKSEYLEEVYDPVNKDYPGGMSDHILFKDGICGSGVEYWCNVSSSDSNKWNCADADGGNTGECTYVTYDADSTPDKYCYVTGGDDAYYMIGNCTGPWDCDSSS
ncbi:hypothetical protein N7528_003050 [Penicillium herquei]|nr:hypothetical protein N7528_003050 [Penicillium herquei]